MSYQGTENLLDSAATLRDEFIWENALQHMPAMLHVLNPYAQIEAVSNAWLEELGYERSEVIGRCIDEFITDECRKSLSTSCFQEVFDVGQIRGARRELRRKDGSAVQVELSANAFRCRRNNAGCLIGLLRKVATKSLGDRQLVETAANGTCGEMIGTSTELKHVCEQIRRVAATTASVLVSGESGVGKELVVRAIHNTSERRGGAFVKVNCAAVPRELFESEFFGHVRGSFTGAWRDRVGKFELADGGTLFLDEVTETPLELQPKLLRVLEEGTFERVGDDRTRKVDVRVIAASNRNLEQAVRVGRLRADLFYRLNVFPIFVPPLRDRRADIKELATHFLQQVQNDHSCAAVQLTDEDIVQLEAYDWPGNIRELRNVIEHAVISSGDGTLNLRDAMQRPTSASSNRIASTESERLMSDAEWQHHYKDNIVSALMATNWKIEGPRGAAQLLGVKPSTFRYRMRALGITRPGPVEPGDA